MTIGRLRSTPNRAQTRSISSSARSLFLSLSGSMEGEMRTCRMDRGREGGRREDRAVVALDIPFQKVPDLGPGVGEVDVASPDPFPPELPLPLDKGDGLGVVDEQDVRARSISAAFCRFTSTKKSRSSPVTGTSMPWRALCMFFVTAKNRSFPLITLHRASTPRSLRRGIIRVRISATPPPTAVELMFRMVFPTSRSARRRSSSTASPRPPAHNHRSWTCHSTRRMISRRSPSSVIV